MLKFKYSFAFLLLFIGNLTAQTTKVLFIGNSYTAVNSLPYLVSSVALANGDTMITNSHSPGGYTFEMHSTDTNAIAKIYSQQWDYVILQEQSQRPSFPPAQVAAEVYPYATILDSMIHDNNPCSETVFYMTWGRKNGDASNCASWPPVCTYEGMQARLRESYMEMALQNNSTVSPVGAAFSYVRSLNPVFDLYSPDESHPSIYGSYLAACVFYATIFHKSPVGTSFISTISQQDAAFLQNAAHAVVIDSLDTWYQYGNIPYAGFNHSVNLNQVQFQNNSLNGTTFLWNFGDGTTSTTNNPTHSYSQSGIYNVSLTVSTNCRTDVFTDSVNVGTTSLLGDMENCALIYNSSNHLVTTSCNNSIQQLSVYDMQGRLIKSFVNTSPNNSSAFDLSGLSNGVYLIQTDEKTLSKTLKVFITSSSGY